MTIRWFGERPFCALAREAPEAEIPIPVGETCSWCEETIAAGEPGMVTVNDAVFHADCFVRSMVGGRRHLLRKCSCYGNSGPEDEERGTKREQATEAVTIFREMMELDGLPFGYIRDSAPLAALGIRLGPPPPVRPAFTCPRCAAVSYNANDIRERYCGRCHRFFAKEEGAS